MGGGEAHHGRAQWSPHRKLRAPVWNQKENWGETRLLGRQGSQRLPLEAKEMPPARPPGVDQAPRSPGCRGRCVRRSALGGECGRHTSTPGQGGGDPQPGSSGTTWTTRAQWPGTRGAVLFAPQPRARTCSSRQTGTLAVTAQQATEQS